MAGAIAELSELLAGVGRLGGLALDLVADRLALLGVEAREAKIRLVQLLLLACLGTALLLLGLVLVILAVLLATPAQWRWQAAAICAAVCLLAGAGALFSLRRRISRMPLAFTQTIAEIKKDRECF